MARYTPSVWNKLLEFGIDPNDIQGTGKGGFITNKDLDDYRTSRFYYPGTRGQPTLNQPQPNIGSSALSQDPNSADYYNRPREAVQRYKSFMERHEALANRGRMDFTGTPQGFDSSVIDNTEAELARMGIKVSRKQVELFPQWGKEDVLSVQQRIRGKTSEAYIAFGPSGGTYLANPDNLGGLRPILGYVDKNQSMSPAQRIGTWINNPERNVMGHAQFEGAEWLSMQRLEAQPGLDKLYRGGIQFGGRGLYDSDRRALMNQYNREQGTDYAMFQGVGSAFRVQDYSGVVPTTEGGNMLISKLKRLKLWTGKISGASLGVGTDLAQDDEPFYFSGQSGPNKSTVFREAFDLFSEHPEGASFANRFLARNEFTKTLALGAGSSFDAATGRIMLGDGSSVGPNSYFGRGLGMVDETMSRAGGIRDFENIFGTSGRSYQAMAIRGLEPEMAEGQFTGRVKVSMSGYTSEYADKYGTKEEPMQVNESYLPVDPSTGRAVDFWRRMPDQKELPAIAMQVFKAEMGSTQAAREAFLDYATDQGVSFMDARKMFSESGEVSGQGTELLSNLAIDRFKAGFQYHERQNVTLSQMQYDALQGQKFSYQGNDYDVLSDVTQNDNGTYTAGTFRTMRRYANVATNLRSEHTRDQMLMKPGAMSVMAQYRPDVFAASAELARERLNKNTAYNVVGSYRANYSPEARSQLESIFGETAKITPDEINAIRGGIRDANPDYNADQMIKATLGQLKTKYDRRSLEVEGPQGSMVLPNARAILGNLTESKDRTLINNWGRMAGEAILGVGDQSPEGQQQLGGLLSRLADPEDKQSLAYHANLQGVLEKAVGFHQDTVGGLARAIPNLGINESLMSMKHVMKVTGIDDKDELRKLASSGSLGTMFRYPWSDPTDQFANPIVSFYEDLPKDSPIRQNFPNPGQNAYVSNEIMAQLHGDVDGDRVATMLNVLKAGEDRIVGGAMAAQSGSDVMGRTKNAFESEYYKYLETMRERSGSFEALRPESAMPLTSDELRQQFEVEEGQARSHLGKVYNALLREMGGSVNPSTESMFGEQHPLTRLIADSVGDINSYGIQSFVDRSAKRDTAFEGVMGRVYRSTRGYRQRNPEGKWEDAATNTEDFYQKKFLEAAKIGGNLKGEGYEDYQGPGTSADAMEYRAKLAPAVATSLINRSELKNLYEQGGEEAVSSRVSAVADMLTDMRTSGSYDSRQLLSLTGASSFSEWGVGTDSLESMSPMAEYITGKLQLGHYENVAKNEGTGSFAMSMGGASVQAGEAALQAKLYKTQVDKPSQGLEALTGNQGGPRALRNWIQRILPGGGNAAQFTQNMRNVPVMQQAAENMSGMIPITGIGEAIATAAQPSGGMIPVNFDDGVAFSNFINQGMEDPGKKDMSSIPIDMDLANSIASKVRNDMGGASGGGKPPASVAYASLGGGDSGGGGGSSGGGSGSNHYHFRTSQPSISTDALVDAAKTLQDLNSTFKDTTDIVKALTDTSSEYNEQLGDTYKTLSKVADYATKLDNYRTQQGADKVAETQDLQVFRHLFGNGQMSQVNQLAAALQLPAIDAKMRDGGGDGEDGGLPLPQGWQHTQSALKSSFQRGVDMRQKELDQDVPSYGDRALNAVGNTWNRLIHGQGLWRSKMAFSMFAQPMIGMADEYLNQQAAQGVSLLQSGQASYSDLMASQFGVNQRRRAGIQEAQLAIGEQAYSAYSPLINFAMGRDGGASILGLAAGVGMPAAGVGIGVTSLTGSPIAGTIAGAGTAAFGLANYAFSNSANYAAIGEIQAGRNGRNLERGQVLGSVIGDILGNPEGAFGAIGAGIRRGTGQMSDEEWGRVVDARELYSSIQQYVGGQFNRQGAIEEAATYGFSSGDVVFGAQEEFLRRQAAQGVSREVALPMLQYYQTYTPNELPQGADLRNMTVANVSGANSAGAIQSYAQSMGVGSTDQGRMANIISGVLGSIAQGENPILTAQFIQENSGIVSGANSQLRRSGLADMQLNVNPLTMDENMRQRAVADTEYMPARARERSLRAQLRQTAPSFYDQYSNQLFDPLVNENEMGNYLTASRREQQIMRSADLYTQASTYGYENAGALAAAYGGMTNETQIGIMDALSSGNRLAISQQAFKIGRPDLRTINTQTGQSIIYQDLDAAAIQMVRSNDRYGYTAGVTDEELSKGTAGLQNEIRNLQQGETRYQRGMQIQGNLLEMTSRYGGAGNMEILRNIGAQYGVTMDSRITRGTRELEDAGIALNRQQQDWSMAQQAAQINIGQRQFETGGRQWYENYNLNVRQFQYNTGMQAQEMQLGREQQVLSQQYQREDLAYNRAQANINFAWSMEDYNRNIRYARGREKRDLMREKKRAVVRFAMQSGQMSKQENRLETSIDYQNKEFELKKEQFEQSIRFRQEEFELQKRHFEENRQFERERMQLQQQNFQMQLQFMREERRLQDEQLLLSRYTQDVNTQMMLEMQQRAFEVQQRVMELTNAVTGMGMAVGQVNSLIDVLKFQIAYMYSQATSGTATRVPVYTPGSGAGLATGTTGRATATQYADGGYTGDGYKYEAKGIVHAGEFVVPQEGALVLKEDDKSIKLLERMVQLLQIVADNPTSFQAIVGGVNAPTTPIYQQAKARL